MCKITLSSFCYLFFSCNTGRKQRSHINIFLSSAVKLVSEVPYCSILGPPLFHIYTFDIFDSVQKSDVQAYADDTQLLYYFDPADQNSAAADLICDLSSVQQFSNEHNLKLNAYKAESLVFSSEKRRADEDEILELNLIGKNLKITNYARMNESVGR